MSSVPTISDDDHQDGLHQPAPPRKTQDEGLEDLLVEHRTYWCATWRLGQLLPDGFKAAVHLYIGAFRPSRRPARLK